MKPKEEQQVRDEINKFVEDCAVPREITMIVMVDLGETVGLKMYGNAHDLIPLLFTCCDQAVSAVAEREGTTKDAVVSKYLGVRPEVIDSVKGAARRERDRLVGNAKEVLAEPGLLDELTKMAKF